MTGRRPTGRACIADLDPNVRDIGIRAARDAVTTGELALLTIAGSYQYGLADPEHSDLDVRGIYVAPTETLLGLGKPAEQFERSDPDLVIFEVGKAVRLAVNGNANFLEILFSPDYLVCTDDGAALRAVAHACVSKEAISRYIGYAAGQYKQAVHLARTAPARGADSASTGRFKGRTRMKHVRHTFRLLHQATEMATTGELTVKVTAALADDLDALSVAPLEQVAAVLDERIATLKTSLSTSALPATADVAQVERCLRDIRLRHLRTRA